MMEVVVARGLPSGTVTFMLTDVVGSTRLWADHPEIATDVIARHRELIGAAVDAWRGSRPLEQGEGDSVVAAFALATDAVRAAHVAQVALAEEPWPDGGVVRVRMALHTGEAEPQDAGTYSGAVLNRCARLRALAHGAQVLVSGATADLVADHLEPDLELVDLGLHRLRDLSRPERVWQLCGPGLELDHPPLQSLDATPNNLPVQLSSFVGREDDIAQGVQLLEQTRLLTLTGAGGCGKTRLAQRVGGEVVDRFPHGTWWVELAQLADPRVIAETVAAAIGLRPSAERPAIDVVIGHLRDDRALVVLDNCEHLVTAVATFVDRLLRACARTSVLATSREPLAVDGEVSWRVPSLTLPPATDVEPSALAQYDAVRLFIDRAVQARPNFRVDNDNAPAVAQICHRLDGIPLAIELAAARTRALPPERIAAELDDRFRLLAGGSRVALPRQQTLFASVDWSHELLDPAERALLRRLGVFAGGFTLDAAEAVTAYAPLDQYNVLEALTRLVDKSLVQAEGARYRLLETIRQYAVDRLEGAGETPASKDRHLEWVSEFVAAHEQAATNARTEVLDVLDAEHPNIRAALGWATSAGRTHAGLRLVAMLAMFWAGRGHYADARTSIPPLLDAAPPDSPAVARARWAGAYVRLWGGDVPAALRDAKAAVDEARAACDDGTAARCLHVLGLATLMFDPVQARALLTEALALARVADDTWCEAEATALLAWSYLLQGLHREAEPLLHRSFALAQNAGSEYRAAWHYTGLAFVEFLRGELPRAQALADQAAALAQRLGDPAVEIWFAAARSIFSYHNGEIDVLRSLATELAASSKDWGLLGNLLISSLAALADVHENPEAAGERLDTLAAAMAEAGVLTWSVQFWNEAAFAALDAGNLDAASQRAGRLDQLHGYVHERGRSIEARAMVERRTGGEGAEELAHEALAVYVEHEIVVRIPRALAMLAGIALDAGSTAEAARLLAAADTLESANGRCRSPAEQAGFDADVARARQDLGDAFDVTWADGAALDWRDAVAYARRARGERKRPTFGWTSLTPTEEQVVALVADGLTNPQIAQKLLMGRETVKTHVASIFTKLGVHNRAELAARATERRTRQGLIGGRHGARHNS